MKVGLLHSILPLLFPLISVILYPQFTLWLLKSPMTTFNGVADSVPPKLYSSFGGLYKLVTVKPFIWAWMISMFPEV